MTRLAILAALVAAPAAADQSLDWQGWTVRIDPAPGPHIAEIHMHNALTRGLGLTEGFVTIDGVGCYVTVTHQPGNTPDSAVIDCGAGHVAVPAILDIPEQQHAIARVFRMDGVGM